MVGGGCGLEVGGWLKVGFLERRRVEGGMGWVVVEWVGGGGGLEMGL